MRKRTILILLVLILSIYASNINVQISAEDNNYRSSSLELTPHDSIEITSDSDFEVFPGTGTVEDPYLIEGYNITTTDYNGIYITGITKYFIVRNCYIDAVQYGIYIDNVADGTATVINNALSNNVFGIWLEDSGNSTVANNTCNNNGIWLWFSGSSTVANNTCNNNGCDILLYSSGSSTVINNTFTNCGLSIREVTLDAYLSNTVENNWVNGKKLGFYTNLDSTIIEEPIYGQLILVNCTNVTVRDQILNNAINGLFLYSCTSSAIINNTCNNNRWGIWLDSSGSSTVINNTCSNNNFWGIRLRYSGSSTVTNNNCSNNNDWGIWLEDSGSSTVSNNTCNNHGEHGISLLFSGSSTITNNTCNNNNNYGIRLHETDFCVITYNLLQGNEGFGVYLRYGSDNNLIHHNTFVDNYLGGTSQAFDDCLNNTWYDAETSEGNYWSDWSKINSYSINGSAGSEDLYPLDEPAEYSTDEIPLNFTFTLLLVIVPLLLTRIISKRTKK